MTSSKQNDTRRSNREAKEEYILYILFNIDFAKGRDLSVVMNINPLKKYLVNCRLTTSLDVNAI